MEQIFYIVIGWTLGLISPTIVDAVKSFFRKREIIAAIRAELEDLQFRLAGASYLLLQQHGKLDKSFLDWIKPIMDGYSGNEPSQGMRELIDRLATANERDLEQIANLSRAAEGVGSSLKIYQAKFLESHISEISKLPVSIQTKIHEFRFHLDISNQETAKADEYFKMTFNPSLGERNHEIVKAELKNKYLIIQRKYRVVADKIEVILREL